MEQSVEGMGSKADKFIDGMEQMHANERAALKAAITETFGLTFRKERERMFEYVVNIGIAVARDNRKKASDKRTDKARRQLIGARLPLETAERCRRCANARGMSLYRFVAEALQSACEAAEEGARPAGVTDCPPEGENSSAATAVPFGLQRLPSRESQV